MTTIPVHAPVMPSEVVSMLAPRPDGFYVDCTLGLGGHTALLLEAGAGIHPLGHGVRVGGHAQGQAQGGQCGQSFDTGLPTGRTLVDASFTLDQRAGIAGAVRVAATRALRLR